MRPESQILYTHHHCHPAPIRLAFPEQLSGRLVILEPASPGTGPTGAAPAAWREAASSESYSQLDFRPLLPHRPQASACNILPKPINLLKLSAIAQTPEGRYPSHPGGRPRPALTPLWECHGQGRKGREKDLFLDPFPSFGTRFYPVPRRATPSPERSAGVPFFSAAPAPPAWGIRFKLIGKRRPRCPPGWPAAPAAGRPGVGWLNLSRVEHWKANAWESGRQRGGYLGIPGRGQGSRRSRRARRSMGHPAPGAAPQPPHDRAAARRSGSSSGSGSESLRVLPRALPARNLLGARLLGSLST